MTDDLDLRRLGELQQLLGSPLPEIVATLVHELDVALRAIGTALADDDLPAAALAAHAARNSALMIDARPLLASLDVLEVGARRGDVPSARKARKQLDAAWPGLRAGLQRAAEAGG